MNAIIDGDELHVPDDDDEKDIAAQTSPSRRNLLGLWRQRRSVFPERQSGDSDQSGHDHASQVSLAAIEVWRRHGAAAGEMDSPADSHSEPAGSDAEEEIRTASVARSFPTVEGEDADDETMEAHAESETNPEAVVEQYVREEAEAAELEPEGAEAQEQGSERFRRDGFVLP